MLLQAAWSLDSGIAYLYTIPFNSFRMWLIVTKTRESKTMHGRGIAITKLP